MTTMTKKNIYKPLKILILLLLLLLLGYALYIGSTLIKSVQNPDQKTDAIIVLTGGENRIREGLKLFANQMAPELFITGVYPTVKKQEIIKNWNGGPLPKCCITLGYEATTTVQNAAEVKKWIAEKDDIKSIRLVTSNYHMNRALLEFKQILKDVKIYAHPIVQDEATPSKLWFWMITIEEYSKSIVRWITFILTNPGTVHGHDKTTHSDHN